jgi:hypothetical protein
LPYQDGTPSLLTWSSHPDGKIEREERAVDTEDIGKLAQPGGGPGSTQHLARLAGTTMPESIPDVIRRLAAIHEYASGTSMLRDDDGIAAFTRLYHIITTRIGHLVDSGEFRDPDFLIRLDIEFAERYLRALRTYAEDMHRTPGVWRLLFDNRSDPRIAPVNFAVAGVNAHINFDLSCALVATWKHVTPDGDGSDSAQFHDYRLINDVFEQEMDPLREELGSFLSRGPDDAIWDRTANWVSDLVIRFTRDLAWDEAKRVWDRGADDKVMQASEEKLDSIASFVGERLLRAPILPV